MHYQSGYDLPTRIPRQVVTKGRGVPPNPQQAELVSIVLYEKNGETKEKTSREERRIEETYKENFC